MKTMSIWLDENPQITTSTSTVTIDSWLLYIGRTSFTEEDEDKIRPHFLSESSLAKDWLKPEENEAWKDL